MSYEHDRNGFAKLLIPPFRKYIHYRGYFLPIFVKKAKRKISQTLNTWKKAEISRVSVCSEKQNFSFARFLRLGSTSTLRHVMIWCALKIPDLKQSFLNNLSFITSPIEKFLSHLKSKSSSKTDENTEISRVSVGSVFSSVFDELFDFRWL